MSVIGCNSVLHAIGYFKVVLPAWLIQFMSRKVHLCPYAQRRIVRDHSENITVAGGF